MSNFNFFRTSIKGNIPKRDMILRHSSGDISGDLELNANEAIEIDWNDGNINKYPGYVEDVLNLTTTYPAYSSEIQSPTEGEKTLDGVFSCDITFPPSTPNDGLIFETGAYGNGHWIGFKNGVLKARVGDGGSDTEVSTTQTAVATTTNYPTDGQVHTLSWDWQINPGRIRIFIDQELIQESYTSNNSSIPEIAGSNSANYLSNANIVTTGDPTIAYSPNSASSLRYYANQNLSKTTSVNITHDYTSAGTYDVKIKGDFKFFKNLTWVDTVVDWGSYSFQGREMFANNTNNIQINTNTIPNIYGDATYMFGQSDFNQNINNWDVSNITNMKYMLAGMSDFNQPLDNWNVSNVINMDFMFLHSPNFNQSLNNWNVSNVTNMLGMFSQATSFNQPLGNWDVSNVTNMDFMFNEASSFNQDITSWCVEQIPTEPTDFSNLSPLINSYKPNWGNPC